MGAVSYCILYEEIEQGYESVIKEPIAKMYCSVDVFLQENKAKTPNHKESPLYLCYCSPGRRRDR